MLQAGVTYQLTPQLNLGTSVYFFDQTHQTVGLAKSKMTLWSGIADYAFSKRTDASPRSGFHQCQQCWRRPFRQWRHQATGVTLGLRHRF